MGCLATWHPDVCHGDGGNDTRAALLLRSSAFFIPQGALADSVQLRVCLLHKIYEFLCQENTPWVISRFLPGFRIASRRAESYAYVAIACVCQKPDQFEKQLERMFDS